VDGAGQVVAATIHWASLDSVLTVLSPDTAGRTVAAHPGLSGRLQAAAGALLSNPLTVRTLVAADTLFPSGRRADTVSLAATPDSLSHGLTVELADTLATATTPDSIVPLAGRPVVFKIVYERMGDSATLIATDTTVHLRVGLDTLVTTPGGLAAVRLRFLGGPLPDTARVTATATRARGAPVPGSPDTLVVIFQP
jgi:hypothetical protein